MDALTQTKIFNYPDISYRIVHHSAQRRVPSPFDCGDATFWLRGSTALWQGLTLLGSKTGGTILFPAYHCGIELNVLRQAGFRCVFYGIDRRLRMDLDAIDRLSGPETCALYVIHYFGFPHPTAELRRFCTAKGWILIEDCAHALFAHSGGKPVGTYGDIGIFSLHKFLPMPSGGALMVNSPHLHLPQVGNGRPPFFYVTRQTIDLLGRGVVRGAFMNTGIGLGLRGLISRGIRLATVRGNEKNASNGVTGPEPFPREWRHARMPGLSLWIMKRTSEKQVMMRRRQNFATLLECTEGCRRIRPLIDHLEEGACPLVFPAAVSGDAAEFIQFCQTRGVLAHFMWQRRHPAFPGSQFPEAVWLRDNVAALPVHQELNEKEMSFLNRVIQDWERGAA
ncbi:MAG: DegT/DnrJ/EryC1/StrS aminotransferase family protein [Deltaproteobacteria bacterium]|nr:DegT/DnrJ/EryC1/StrS aminotransferase family protein [Deltaproteobacteria bacterium]